MISEDNRHLLRIKIKSLAVEARFIREAELNIIRYLRGSSPSWKDSIERGCDRDRYLVFQDQKRAQMYAHRVFGLRTCSRAALLAYAFIRGKSVRLLERHPEDLLKPCCTILLDEVIRNVRKFGSGKPKAETEREIKDWINYGSATTL